MTEYKSLEFAIRPIMLRQSDSWRDDIFETFGSSEYLAIRTAGKSTLSASAIGRVCL